MMSPKTEGQVLFNAAKIIRQNMFKNEITFDGDLLKQRQKESAPAHLILLIGMILEESSAGNITETTSEFSTAHSL